MVKLTIEDIIDFMNRDSQLLQAKIVVDRLARLSADSIWAHRASGLRASLDKAVGSIRADSMVDSVHLEGLITLGFQLLNEAAKEIPVPEDILFKHKY